MKKNLIIAAFCALFLMGCQEKDAQTIKDLKTSIINESTVGAKYTAFAAQARSEKLDTIARLFDAIAKSERIHAETFQDLLDEKYDIKVEEFNLEFKVGKTTENLKVSLEREKSDMETDYPAFIIAAKKDKVEKAVKAFTLAMEGEKKHIPLLKKAIESLNPDTVIILPSGYSICPICGNMYDDKAIENKCSLCGTHKKIFIPIH